MGIQGWQLIIVLVVILLLFGGRKLPELARSLGQARTELQKGMDEGAPGSVKEPQSDETHKD